MSVAPAGFWIVRRSRGPAMLFAAPGPARVSLVGIDDVLNQWVAHDVGTGEARESDASHVGEHRLRFDQAALLPAIQIDLRDVAGDDGFRSEADARQEHLHL